MVVSFMRDMSEILKPAPFKSLNISAHTATWGAIRLYFNGLMSFNLNSFEGLWSNAHFEKFKKDIENFFKSL